MVHSCGAVAFSADCNFMRTQVHEFEMHLSYDEMYYYYYYYCSVPKYLVPGMYYQVHVSFRGFGP